MLAGQWGDCGVDGGVRLLPRLRVGWPTADRGPEVIRPDQAVFAAAQAGDPVALDRLLRELQPDIRRYARRQCHRSAATEDVVREALLVVYQRIGSVHDPLALAAWVFRMVTRLCMLPLLALMRGTEELTERHETAFFARLPTDELRLDLVRALESLPAMYRDVILLRDMEQLTISEVTERLGITREATKSRLLRARALVREFLGPREATAR
ncbi:MAG: sigma-70 family RNA polymerase sigma factor [Proteobacteria bacterium]|nr:sigma-70 family RNA polymerase sigma factor [Pseudomonadota bacterium]